MAYPILQHTIIPWLLGRVRIEGEERLPTRGPFIIAANHVSYVEPMVLAALLMRRTNHRIAILTKYPVWKLFRGLGLAGWLGMVPVPRQKLLGMTDEAFATSKKLVVGSTLAAIRDGASVLMFPEGTRSRDGELGYGKTGAVRLALAAGVPIFPAGYIGPPSRNMSSAIRTLRHESKNIHIRIGRPLRFSAHNPTHDDLASMTSTLMHAIGELAEKPYRY